MRFDLLRVGVPLLIFLISNSSIALTCGQTIAKFFRLVMIPVQFAFNEFSLLGIHPGLVDGLDGTGANERCRKKQPGQPQANMSPESHDQRSL
ncbi:MAG: hypothetical protein KGY53_09135 [Wenzhouxiangellaceae bacterium]|nr:hypothetical protein [Wenzhouxiangellaceae bacterium]